MHLINTCVRAWSVNLFIYSLILKVAFHKHLPVTIANMHKNAHQYAWILSVHWSGRSLSFSVCLSVCQLNANQQQQRNHQMYVHAHIRAHTILWCWCKNIIDCAFHFVWNNNRRIIPSTRHKWHETGPNNSKLAMRSGQLWN